MDCQDHQLVIDDNGTYEAVDIGLLILHLHGGMRVTETLVLM